MRCKSLVGVLVITFVAAGSSGAMNLGSWAACIKVANSSCTLDPGAYTETNYQSYNITLPFTLANGVTAMGGGTSNYSTSLQRPANWTGHIVYVPSGANVTISNLTFDGNRYSFSNSQVGCISNMGVKCGPSSGSGCTQANWNVIDVEVDGAATIDNVPFWNSPGVSLYINLGNVYSASVYYSRSTGTWLYGGGTVDSGAFQYNGTAGLRISATAGTNANYNSFFQNRYEMPDGSGGGQLYIDYNAANISAELNTINGNNWQTSSSEINNCYPPPTPQGVAGIEVEPDSTGINLLANAITGNPGNGVSVHSANVVISGYTTYPNNPQYIQMNTGSPSGYSASGIQVYTTSYGPSTVELLDVLSRRNSYYDVDLDPATGGTGWVGYQCINTYTPAVDTNFHAGNQSPSNTTTCP